MFKDGFVNIESIDFSSVVVNKMNLAHAHTGITYKEMSVESLSFVTGSFDVIIDKGTIDCLLCAHDSNKPINNALSECRRVLKPRGMMFVVSYGQPASRLSYFDRARFRWTVNHQVLPHSRFLYVMTCLDDVEDLKA